MIFSHRQKRGLSEQACKVREFLFPNAKFVKAWCRLGFKKNKKENFNVNVLHLFLSKSSCTRMTHSQRNYHTEWKLPSSRTSRPLSPSISTYLSISVFIYVSVLSMVWCFSFSLPIILVGAILINRETTAHYEVQRGEGGLSKSLISQKSVRLDSQHWISGVIESNIHEQGRKKFQIQL